jgi:hypothetical protein
VYKEVVLATFFYADFFFFNSPNQKPNSSITPSAINATAPLTVPMK